ncbi:hypothetical protein BDZ97DRAFT_1611458, partial [Flammula alnicola]
NFAMTDYASQGKTREYNVVHPTRCKDHMSYYTCLSRSSSAEGTILLKEPDADRITKGISGFLRQECRELHVLDEVTKLKYEGLLPEGILHPLRNLTVRAYVLWNKSASNEKSWHSALAYGPGENRLKRVEADGTWFMNMNLRNVDLKGKKRLIDTSESPAKSPAEKVKRVARCAESQESVGPCGLIWDADNYSCAYDSIFTVLHSIWLRDTRVWQRRLGDISSNLELLSRGFEQALNNESTLEMARNRVRDSMIRTNPAHYPIGMRFTNICRVVDGIIPGHLCGISTLACDVCGYRQANPLVHFGEHIELTSTGRFHNDSEDTNCPDCVLQQSVNKLSVSIWLERMPYLIFVEFSSPRYIIDHELNYNTDGFEVQFRLAGLIYGGQNHFVCRIVDAAGAVWYHDGITTGSGCVREGSLSDIVRDT